MSEEVDSHVERRYELVQKLGKGAYGIVWRAVDRKTKKLVALKKVFDAFSNQTDSQRTYREVMFLQNLNHENIIKLLHVMKSTSGNDLYLVFELMETDLHAVIRSRVMQDVHKQFVTYQLLRCIRHLHRLQIIHRDLKPANVLLNSDCHVKLADFGLARSLATLKDETETRPVLTDYIATRWYRAPENLLASVKYTTAADMWALGTVIGEMFLDKPILAGTSTMNQLERVLAVCGMPSKDDIAALESKHAEPLIANVGKVKYTPLRSVLASLPEEAADLVTRLLQFNPHKRLTAAEAMRHPFVLPFCTPDELADDVECAPLTIPLKDFTRFSVDEYRAALYHEILKSKKELKKKKREKKAAKAAANTAAGEEYEDDYEPEE